MEPASPQPEVTVLLARARAGDAQALGAAFSAMYEELKRSARSQLRRSRQGFQTTALVHEAFLKLAGGAQLTASDRNHLLALSARAMRQVLVDDARARQSDKRGGGREPVTLTARVDAGEQVALVHIPRRQIEQAHAGFFVAVALAVHRLDQGLGHH